MSHPADTPPPARRVVLPSGRSVEVLYFDAPAPTTERDLSLCPDCGRDRVLPVRWEEVSGQDWTVTLRCPDCEWHEVGTFSQAVVDRFDAVLDEAADQLAADLRNFTRANMEEQLDRFIGALQADAILPEDF